MASQPSDPPDDPGCEPKMIGATYAYCATRDDQESLPVLVRLRLINLYGLDPVGVLGDGDWYELVAPIEGELGLIRQRLKGKHPGLPLKLLYAADRRFEQITGRLNIDLPKRPKPRKKGKPPGA